MISVSLKTRLVSWGPPMLWMALIFVGSSIHGGEADMMTRQASGVDEPVRIQRIKDAIHIVEYGVLTLLLVRAFTRRIRPLSPRHAGMSFAIAALYGISDEIHQLFVPLRSADVNDVVRNVIGAGLAIALAVCLQRRKRKG